MRQALLAFSLVLGACGGAAATNSTTAVVPSASPPPAASDTSAPPPPASAAAAATVPPPATQALCPASGRISFEGGQGTSIADAIRVVGAKGESDGIASEYKCLDAALGSRRNGKWKVIRQALVGKDGKSFDVLSVLLQDGTKKDFYFDISDYFGKF